MHRNCERKDEQEKCLCILVQWSIISATPTPCHILPPSPPYSLQTDTMCLALSSCWALPWLCYRVKLVCRVCFQVVTHQWFDPAILGLIILNMILICMGYRYTSLPLGPLCVLPWPLQPGHRALIQVSSYIPICCALPLVWLALPCCALQACLTYAGAVSNLSCDVVLD